MGYRQGYLWVGVALVALSGCGGSAENASAPISTMAGPKQVVGTFLEAVRTGDDAAATALLSPLAREKLQSDNRPLTPPASDTASFEVGRVEEVSTDKARVGCTWTDLDADGRPQTDEAEWSLRREPEGWRITGVAYPVFDDVPPVVLNFEDPEEMARQQQWVIEEDHRRALQAQRPADQAQRQAEAAGKIPGSIRR